MPWQESIDQCDHSRTFPRSPLLRERRFPTVMETPPFTIPKHLFEMGIRLNLAQLYGRADDQQSATTGRWRAT
jgi:hypothetical protein